MNVVHKVIVHEHLKSQGWSAEAKEHHCWFEQSKWGDEYSLPFVTFLDVDVVIPPLDIEFSETGELSQIIDKVRDKEKQIK